MSWSLVSGSWGALGLWGGLTAVGGEPSLPPSSSSPPLPTPRSWEARATRLTLSSRPWDSPRPPSPARAGTSKRPPRDPVAEGEGGPRGGALPGSLSSRLGADPRDADLGFCESLQARERGLGAELCDLAHATACLWASASPAARLSGWGWSRERSLGKLALSVRCRDHFSCLHTAALPLPPLRAGPMSPHSLSQVSPYKFREGR